MAGTTSAKSPPKVGQLLGQGNHLEVIEKTSLRGNGGKIIYRVRCSVCEKDPEMYGDGIFDITSTGVNLSYIPCGCSKVYKRSREQYEILARRRCAAVGYTFVGIPAVTGKIRFDLECAQGHTWRVQATNFLNQNQGCGECNHRIDDSTWIKRFEDTCKFARGTVFRRDALRPSEEIWYVECPVCEVDKFAWQSGFIFKSTGSLLSQGAVPCRCGYGRAKTATEQEQHLKDIAANHKLSFIGWVGEYSTLQSRFTVRCAEHGIVETNVINFTKSGTKCPKCAKGGFKKHLPAYVYVLRVGGPVGDFTGYGITNFIDARLYTHKCAVGRYGFRIDEYKSFEMSAVQAINIEQQIKDTFPIFSQDITGFRTEATFPQHFQDVVEFVLSNVDNA